MASFSEKIKITIDVIGDQASGSLSKFRTSLAEADGAAGKFKAGASGALDFVKNNAAGFAAAAGAALLKFGVDSVNAFNDLAIEAGELRDKLGLTSEEASRLIEVAGDVGIEVGALEKSIGKMNLTVAKSPEAFDNVGAAIARNKDGTVDVNQTFLNTVDALNGIPDASERAAAAQKIFGKGWADIAELVQMSSEELKTSLEGVSDSKVIDDSEVEKAREYRAAMDNLGDAAQDVALIVGEQLVPVVTDAAEALGMFQSAAQKVGDLIPGPVAKGFELLTGQIKRSLLWPVALKDAFNLFGGEAEKTIDINKRYGATQDLVNDSIRAAISEQENLAAKQEALTTSTHLVNEAITEAKEAHDNNADAMRKSREEAQETANAFYGLENATFAMSDAVAEATETLSNHDATSREARESLQKVATSSADVADEQVRLAGVNRDTVRGQQLWNDSMIETASMLSGPMQTEVLAHTARVNGIPETKITDILTDLDPNDVAQVQEAINGITGEDVNVTAVADTRSAEQAINYAARDRSVRMIGAGSKFAKGTEYAPGGTALVGEQGPELVDLPAGSRVSTAGETAEIMRNGGGGRTTVTYVTQNFPAGTRPTDVIEAQRRWERRNGPA